MLIYGNEPYLINQEKNNFINQFVSTDDNLNCNIFRNKVDINELRELATTVPFCVPYRVIVLEYTDILKTDITELLKALPETTKLLIIEESVDKKFKSYKWFKENDEIKICDSLKEADLIKWINSFVSLDAQYLVRKIGTNMYHITNEVNKLIMYTEGQPITNAIIDKVCSDVAEDKVFDMMDAIALRNSQLAMDLYHDLMELRTPAMKTLALLRRHFVILNKIKILANADNKSIASVAGVQPWLVGKYKTQATSFTEKELSEVVNEILDVDTNIKNGLIKDQVALESLICKLLYR